MKKPRKIIIVEPAGYCRGVDRAIKIAKKTKEKYPNREVIVLGMLVHNLDAIKELDDMGIKTISNKTNNLLDLIDNIRNDSIVILTAHGHSDEVERKLNLLNISFVDATCPFVKKALIDMKEFLNEGRDIIYIGKENHPESNAALSLSNKVHLLTFNGKIDESLKTHNPVVVSQSTFSNRDVTSFQNKIKEKLTNVTIYPSICNASLSRQKSLLSLDKNTDLIIVVGGINSNNTITLYNLAKKNFKNAKILLIENKNDLNINELSLYQNIAIVSGASTPIRIVNEIKLLIEQLND